MTEFLNQNKGRVTQQGFTLLELMIVVVVVAILASVAYPSYTESVRKGRRAEARAALTELMQQQERYMTQNNTYMAFAAGAAGVPFVTTAGNDRNNPSYNLSAQACPNFTVRDCIMLTATPVQADTRAGALTLTSLGQKDCTGTERTTNPRVCWP